jgi:hypothetical protein
MLHSAENIKLEDLGLNPALGQVRLCVLLLLLISRADSKWLQGPCDLFRLLLSRQTRFPVRHSSAPLTLLFLTTGDRCLWLQAMTYGSACSARELRARLRQKGSR